MLKLKPLLFIREQFQQKISFYEFELNYYIRDKFKPLKQHQDNIHKLLKQFSEQQLEFLEVVQIRSSFVSDSEFDHFKPINHSEADNNPSLINILSSRTASILNN